jgi:peptidoglycan/xylan/chitin deacetylase (PgdA/CDA1 family)
MADFFRQPLLALDMPEGSLALTFDDGPTRQSGLLGEYLSNLGIKAVFFVTGKRAKALPEQLRRLAEMGHIVGNHTYSHVALPQARNPVNEIRRTDDLICPHIESEPILFRAPFGRWSSDMPARLDNPSLRPHLGPIHWDVGSYGADWWCWKPRVNLSIEQCGQRYLRDIDAHRQGIVLLHDCPKTFEMILWLIPRLLRRDYEFTDVYASQNLAHAARYVMSRRGQE